MDEAPPPWRLLPPIEASGPWQMAIDRWLLQQAVAGDPRPILRFYRWSRPTLSLGRHQPEPDPGWTTRLENACVDLVRRPSGGGAVLHADDLTYALIWPQAPNSRREAYTAACSWLVEGFARLGLELQFGRVAASGPERNCFSRSTAADLVEPSGAKRIGSAQHWHRGCLLQHGSILIAPDGKLWQRIFGSSPPVLGPLPDAVRHWRDLADHLSLIAAETLQPPGQGAIKEVRLSPADWEEIHQRIRRP